MQSIDQITTPSKDMDMDKLQMSLEDQLRTAAAQVHFCF